MGSPDALPRSAPPANPNPPILPFSLLGWAWVPIRSLAPRHRPRIAAHLLSLDEHDRYLRFGFPASDEQIAQYVQGLDFSRDEIFGIFNRRLELIAMAHLAYAPPTPEATLPQSMAEFGVSVMAHARGRGYGAPPFEHAMFHAPNRRMETLFLPAPRENTATAQV